MSTPRLDKLLKMLEREPEDVFLLYGAALEYKKLDRHADALAYLRKVLEKDPGYCVAYMQSGQVHELAKDLDAARQAYRDGVAMAAKKGENHARDEMQAALDALG